MDCAEGVFEPRKAPQVASISNNSTSQSGVIPAGEARTVLRDPVAADLQALAVEADFLAGYTGNTRAAYANDLRTWFDFCLDQGFPPLSATRVEVSSFLDNLGTLGRSSATIARRLATLRGFYGLAVEEYGLTRSPANRIRCATTKDVTRKRALTAGQLAAFLNAADRTNPRTAGLAWLLATTGLRISEACQAHSADVFAQDDEHWLNVMCKGGIRRSVPLHAVAWSRLALLPAVPTTGPGFRGEDGTSAPLFATRTGLPVDRNAAARTLIGVAKQAGISERFSPHVLRHTFVTLARGQGCALEDVQQATGHANPATTRGYDHTLLGHHNHPGTRIVAGLHLLRDRPIVACTGEGHA